MDAIKFPPRPSAATPTISALQAKLVNQIDQGDTYIELYATVVEMGEELESQDVVNAHDMITALREDKGRQMTVLLHTIPRPVLRSIVMRMVAYDFWERDSDNRTLLYDKEGPGAYIVTLSIVDRRGHTWSVNENKELINLVETYARAIETYEKHCDTYGHSQLCVDELAAMQVAANIDKQYEKLDFSSPPDSPTSSVEYRSNSDVSGIPDWWSMPRFVSSSETNKSWSVRHLVSMLRKRNIAGVDQNEPSKQSVCMVGSADDFEKHIQKYRLISALRNTTHCWGLLVSCLKYANLEPQETIIPVCKAWKIEHINMAEILVTVLAGSLISVGGLDIKQPGTKSEKNPPSDRVFESCRRHVCGAKPWFEENMAHSNPPMKRLIDAERELESMDHNALQESVAEVKRLDQELTEKLAKLEAIEKHQEEDQKVLGEAEEIVRFCTDNPDVIDALSFFS
ncbi:uncharacterized protein F4817DRAFT_365612 [Daldinia loculata]|uniref:uncharacterized protein n=1 Tax=Daldinia loculata TaxID=103429 RepID=UPI0020C3725E|nr:uncharacterized protein F4817DRAFT_365612 [Daldinia loculata]KAI1646752.1 hypothetical protein F4817DRAFT_365612 [Daldinia loculata]